MSSMMTRVKSTETTLTNLTPNTNSFIFVQSIVLNPILAISVQKQNALHTLVYTTLVHRLF